MTKRIEHSIHVDAPAAEIFAILDDWTRTKEYMAGVKEIRHAGGPASGPGSSFDVDFAFGPLKIKARTETTDHTPPSGYGWKTVKGPNQTGWWRLVESGGGTEVTLGNEISYGLRQGGPPAEMVAAKAADGSVKESLANLKALAERPAT